MPLIFRTDDTERWGSGKGANLSPLEVDENFWDLHERIVELETNGTPGVGVVDITIIGTEITFQMSDASTLGPFSIALPQMQQLVIVEIDNDTTLAPTNSGKYHRVNSDNTEGVVYLTIPEDDTENLIQIGVPMTFRQVGTAQIEFVSGTGVVLLSPASLRSRAQGSTVSIIKVDDNTYEVGGDLAGISAGAAVLTYTADHILNAEDSGGYLRIDQTSTDGIVEITVPDDVDADMSEGVSTALRQVGTDQIFISAGGGAVVSTPSTFLSRTQGSTIYLVKVGPNEWDLSGDLEL